MIHEDTVKREHKNNLFCAIFEIKENFVHLYKECSGKTITPEEITKFDLRSAMVARPFVNDVSFLTNDHKLLIFVEHMSTNSPHIAFRFLQFYVHVIELWLLVRGKNLARDSNIILPEAEFYVAYNGVREMKEPKLEQGFIKVSVKYIDISFDKLKNHDPKNPLAGYSYSYKNYRNPPTGADVFEYAVQKCKEAGYLSGIVDKEDFAMYQETVTREEEIMYGAWHEGLEEGLEKGIEKGKEELARNLLANGVSPEIIAKSSYMSVEQVRSLIS